MKEYLIKYELIDPRTKEVVKLETKRYLDQEKALDEYTGEAMKRTTMGIMEMVVAELYVYSDKNALSPSLKKIIVDNR